MAKKKSLKGKGTYAVYRAEGRAEKNRKIRLARHLKRHPLDAQAERAAGKPGTQRTAPSTKQGKTEAQVRIYDRAGNLIPMPSFTPEKRTA